MIHLNFFVYLTTYWWVLKAPPLKSSDVHFSVIKFHCWTYDDNIGPKLKKPSFAILGMHSMFDNKFDQCRTEVCPEIEKKPFSNNLLNAPPFGPILDDQEM